MLVPQFSLRDALKGFTVCAVLFLIAGQAVAGHGWAIGVTVAVISVLCTLAVHAACYGLTVWLARLFGAQEIPARTSQGGLRFNSDQEQLPQVSGDSEPAKGPSQL